MSDEQPSSMSSGMNLRSIIPSIIINGAIPLIIFQVLKQYHYSDLVALSVAALFPAIGTLISIIRTRHIDLIAAIALIGIAVSIIAVFIGGDPRLLLIRESFLTGALGIACFVSFLLPRPLMFYFGRYFAAGNDPTRIAQYNANWQYPYFRYVNRIITVVWGVSYLGEFILRVIMVYTLPIPVVLGVSPIILGGITVATIAWTMAYANRARKRGEEMRREAQEARIS